LAQAQTVAVEVESEADIVTARVRTKAVAEAIGFNYMDQTRIATAVSELARNAFQYAGKGKVRISPINIGAEHGIEIVVEDHGPGIKDLESAVKGGYSTSRGLGMGLSGSRKLMDEFEIKTKIGEGTTIRVRKWM
jgi:serine/threonine-protein kinase RsbT